MDIIMIPGLWLDGSSWSAVTPPLEQAGHRVRALTLPGKESKDADRTGITLRDHVDFVVAAIDEAEEPVVLVGHSGGGAIAQLAGDARPEKVARVVYVDAAPMPDGAVINDDLPIVGEEIPLPEWSFFEDEDLVDLDDALRDEFRARSIPEPKAIPFDRIALTTERRRDVPTTIICCEFPSKMILEWIDQGAPFVREIAAMKHVEYVDLPTGHWPQFTKPTELGQAILNAVSRTPAAR
ncbi:alpha/beta hydrolase [Glycomyces sp. L485]|uniref:alpha/beta fold hydrolase n=1 Tax=Glycomyces sp. L485 TaxID=2909235 RepID=UPI001F4AC63D|nr:alpha/beta hydrolase [Glycomyces sp. L485]MCH7232714.1 alpha/beta hydrolase [Glycomyces sp. L485]